MPSLVEIFAASRPRIAVSLPLVGRRAGGELHGTDSARHYSNRSGHRRRRGRPISRWKRSGSRCRRRPGRRISRFRRSGNGRSVVILGAGIAGLVSAYELRRAGYRVTVLEARDRIGGRVVDDPRRRHGSSRPARPDQRATFVPGLYFNAGPARIPCTHRAILGYARRFGVPMETFINVNRNAGWDFGGKVHPERRMVERHARPSCASCWPRRSTSMRSTRRCPRASSSMIREFLALMAQLDDKGSYTPGGSSGYAVEGGGYAQAPVPLPPLGFDGTRARRARSACLIVFEHIWDMQATMLQPVGGMDRIAHAIYEQVKPTVRLNTPVTRHPPRRRPRPDRAWPGQAGDRGRLLHLHAAAADPRADPERFFGRPRRPRSKRRRPISTASRSAFEAPRFWETDDNIFGGLAWTDRLNENVIYPSDDIGAPKGVLVGAYVAGWTNQDNPRPLRQAQPRGALPDQPRIDRGAASGPIAAADKGVTVAWGLTPYSEGVGALWPDSTAAAAGAGRGAAICRAAQARRSDRLRRRASELPADLAGRRGDCPRTRR